MQTTDQPETPNGLTVRWSSITITLGVIAAASLGTLAVIASVKGADALSTVALALAVLAFAAQLIVSLAQGMSGAQQLAQAERINASTQAALSSLQSATEALLSTQKDQFGRVLQAALHRAVPEAVEETLSDSKALDSNATQLDVDALQAALADRIESSLRRIVGEQARDTAWWRTQGRAVGLTNLKPSAYSALQHGVLHRHVGKSGVLEIGPNVKVSTTEDLIRGGYALSIMSRGAPGNDGPGTIIVLTPAGREAVELLQSRIIRPVSSNAEPKRPTSATPNPTESDQALSNTHEPASVFGSDNEHAPAL